MTAEKKPLPSGTTGFGPRLVVGARVDTRETPVDAADDPAREPMLRAQKGDLDAFRVLIEMFQDRVYRIVTSILHCDRATAEDMSQEVFLRVHKGLPQFDGQARMVTWVSTIATNVAITEYRRRKAQKRARKTTSIDAPIAGTDDLHVEPVGDELDPGEAANQNEFAARVRTCVRELPDEFREAVILRDMENLSYEEIAEALGVPAGTVRSRIHRGRLLLQQMLKEFA
ncbi:MAG: sigma-70 family RNA polymerase sigma factor [Planctomycetes bacterium]|nr:sigma-70 family RNA polymerase sigma factor [Planctomycetota bacterium]